MTPAPAAPSALRLLPSRRVAMPSPWPALRTGLPLLLADLVAFGAATAAVDAAYRAATALPASFLFAHAPWVGAALCCGLPAAGLLPGTGLSPLQELRRFGALGALLALVVLPGAPGIGAILATLCWAVAFVLGALVLRGRLRNALADRAWWGEGAIVVGAADAALRAGRMLSTYRRQGLQLRATIAVGDERNALGVAERVLHAAELHGATWTVVSPELAVRWRAVDRFARSVARPRALVLTAMPGGGRGLAQRALPLLGYEGRVATNASLLPIASRLRRAADALVAAALLVLLLPVLVTAALALRLRGGPVLDGTWALGRDGAMFRMLRFAAPAGHWIARTHVDSLPRILDVLRGHLAWFGPEPLQVATAARHGAFQPFHLAVRPGVFGLSQLAALSGATNAERVRLDVEQATADSPSLSCALAVHAALAAVGGRAAADAGIVQRHR